MPKNLRPWLRFITNETASPGEGGSGGGGGEQETVPAPGEGENEQTDPEGLGEKGLKALQREREARKQAEKRIAELESGNLPLVQLQDELKAAQSELKAAQQAAQTATQEVATVKAEALRYRIAAQFGISTKPGDGDKPSDAEMFLTGDTEEQLISQAQRLADLRKASLGDGLVDPTQGGGSGKPEMDNLKPGAERLASAFDAQITSK